MPDAEQNTVTSGLRLWKTIGYPKFTKFLVSDDDFFVLRRFSELTARVLLAAQDELAELEAQLSHMDTEVAESSDDEKRNDSFRYETMENRLELIHEIDRKLRAYHELVIHHSNLRTRPCAEGKDITSIRNWFHNHPHAILEAETEYINHDSDLFNIAPAVRTPLRRLLERSSGFRKGKLWRRPVLDNDDEDVWYSSNARIDRFVSLVITVSGLAMLIAPLWLLAYVEEIATKLGIITAFTVGFVGLLSLTAVARPFESLAGAAAYAAVLVVFLQSV